MKINKTPNLGDVRRMELEKPPEERGKNLVLPKVEEPQTQFHSNMNFIENLMNCSPFGGLGQIFIIEAIRHYAKTASENNPGPADPEFKGLVSPQTWHMIAVDVHERMSKYLKQG
jgi:hypothetical protein